MDDIKEVDKYMHSLHVYFAWSDKMRFYFYNVLNEIGNLESATPEQSLKLDMFMSYWYAGMYVVIEGWRKLNIKNSEIDRYLDSDMVGKLKGYRNRVFHFKKKFYSQENIRFIEDVRHVDWVCELTDAFRIYFNKFLENDVTTRK